MTLIDAGIVLILLISVAISLARGFFKEFVGLLVIVVALSLATLLAPQFGSLFVAQVDSPFARGVIAWLVLFVGAYLIGALIRYLVGKLRAGRPLTKIDRGVGGLFGLLRGAIIVALIVLAAHLDTFSSLRDDQMWHDSFLLPPFVKAASVIHTMMPTAQKDYFDFQS